MMLTPEQLRNMRQAANGLWKVEFDGRGIRQIVAHIDAQQEEISSLNSRIAELEQQLASANNFAGCATHEPEPVNRQMLAALKRLLHKAYKQNWQDNYPSEVECAESAINAAMQK